MLTHHTTKLTTALKTPAYLSYPENTAVPTAGVRRRRDANLLLLTETLAKFSHYNPIKIIKRKRKQKQKKNEKKKKKDLKGLHYEKTLPLLGGETHVPWRDQAQKLPQGSRMFPRRGPRPLDPRNQLGQISKMKEERKAKVLLKSIYHLCVL